MTIVLEGFSFLNKRKFYRLRRTVFAHISPRSTTEEGSICQPNSTILPNEINEHSTNLWKMRIVIRAVA